MEHGRALALQALLKSDHLAESRTEARAFLVSKHGTDSATSLIHRAVAQPYVAVVRMLFQWLGICSPSGEDAEDGGAGGADQGSPPNQHPLLEAPRSDGSTPLQASVVQQCVPEDADTGRPVDDLAILGTDDLDKIKNVNDGGLPEPRFCLEQMAHLTPYRAVGDHGLITKFLLECGAGVKPSECLAALHRAFFFCKPVTARAILDKFDYFSQRGRTDPDFLSFRQQTARAASAMGSAARVKDVFVSYVFRDMSDRVRYADKGREKIIDVNEWVDAFERYKNKPLLPRMIELMNINRNREKLAMVLLDYAKGTDKDCPTVDPNQRVFELFGAPTPLFIAAKTGQEVVVRALLSAGADPRIATLGKAECEKLLAEGEDPAVAQAIGALATRTPLFGAPEAVSRDTPRFGIYYNATPLHIACLMGHAKIAEMLLEHDGCGNAGGHASEEDTKALSEALVQVDPMSDPGFPPQLREILKEASFNTGHETVEVTALGLATLQWRSEVVAVLSKHELELVAKRKEHSDVEHPEQPSSIGSDTGSVVEDRWNTRLKNFGHHKAVTPVHTAEPTAMLAVAVIHAGDPDCRAIVQTFANHGTDFSGQVRCTFPFPEPQAEATHLLTARHFFFPMLLMMSNASEEDVLVVLQVLLQNQSTNNTVDLNSRVTFCLYEKRSASPPEFYLTGEEITWSVLSLARKLRPNDQKLESDLLRLGATVLDSVAEEGVIVKVREGSYFEQKDLNSPVVRSRSVEVSEGDVGAMPQGCFRCPRRDKKTKFLVRAAKVRACGIRVRAEKSGRVFLVFP